jgi:NAD(P)-dependent dehydrogenase (short-subunit alcohol dehydrogenase family)
MGLRIERELIRDGAEAMFVSADLSRPEEARKIVPFTISTFGRLDYAFNNAGLSER